MKLNSAILITLSVITTGIASAKVYGIGARVEGDQLLINDTLYKSTKSMEPTNQTIEFQFPVEKLVSYIEVASNNNVHAQFGLTHNNILYGLLTAIDAIEIEMKIRVFGIDENEAPAHFHPLLTPDRELERMVVPYEFEEEDEYYDTDNFDDNILALGERQQEDELIFETYQHSEASEKPENHSVVFYFIDSYYLTCSEFITIHTDTASATFSQVSDHSIKAVIYDESVLSLDVKFKLYGYRPDRKPLDFRPMLSTDSQNDYQVIRHPTEKCPHLALIQFHSKSTNVCYNFLLVLLCLVLSITY